MNFINEYALLVAVALPVVVIAGIQVALYLAGERETLLMPGFTRYPSIPAAAPRAVDMTPAAEATQAAAVEPSNDEVERLAA